MRAGGWLGLKRAVQGCKTPDHGLRKAAIEKAEAKQKRKEELQRLKALERRSGGGESVNQRLGDGAMEEVSLVHESPRRSPRRASTVGGTQSQGQIKLAPTKDSTDQKTLKMLVIMTSQVLLGVGFISFLFNT